MKPRFQTEANKSARQESAVRDADGTELAEVDVETTMVGLAVEPVDQFAETIAPVAEIEGLYVPQGYEPNYAYPLIVWLTTVPVPEREFQSRMQRISDRNYLAVAVPINASDEHGDLNTQIRDVVRGMRVDYHVHTERIFLAGTNEAGTISQELALRFPDQYGGAISLGGEIPRTERLLAAYKELSGLRMLLGWNQNSESTGSIQRWQRILFAAGIDVEALEWEQTGSVPNSVWRPIDRWLMAGIERQSAVWA